MAAKRKTKKTWSERCKDPRWQKLRLKRLEADGWRCRECGSEARTLNVHHRFYKHGADPWEYDGKDLVTLCERCHAATEDLLFEIRGRAGMGTMRDMRRIVEFLREMKFEEWTPAIPEPAPQPISPAAVESGFAALRAMMGRS